MIPQRTPTPPGQPSCFRCVHYELIDSYGFCRLYDEDIDSEVFAAKFCPSFETEYVA